MVELLREKEGIPLDVGTIVTELPKTVETIPDLLKVPTFRIDSKKTKNKAGESTLEEETISVSWVERSMTVRTPKKITLPSGQREKGITQVHYLEKKYFNVKRRFTFRRSKDPIVPGRPDKDTEAYPTVEHSKYFHILLGLFIENRKRHGGKRLYFRFRDILLAAGKHPNSKSDTIKSAIKRYQSCVAVWTTYLNEEDGEGDTLSYTCIRRSSVVDEEEKEYRTKGDGIRNPRKSKNRDTWQYVDFDEEVIKTLENYETRYFLSEVFKGLTAEECSVYRYYYAHYDKTKKGQKVSHTRSLDFLMQALWWRGRKDKFRTRLMEIFDSLQKYEDPNFSGKIVPLIEEPEWSKDREEVKIRCRSYTEVLEDIDHSVLKIPTTRPSRLSRKIIDVDGLGEVDLENCDDKTLLATFFVYKKDLLIPEEECSAIDMLLTLKSMQKSALDIIRKTIISLHTVSS